MAKRMDAIDFSRFADCACLNLRKAARAVTQFYDRALKPSGLRATQFNLLCELIAAGSATLSDLARDMVMDRTTLSRDLNLLKKIGLVDIFPGRDRRTRVVSVTDQGRVAVFGAIPLWEEAQSHMTKGLGKKRWRKLLARLSGAVSLVRDV